MIFDFDLIDDDVLFGEPLDDLGDDPHEPTETGPHRFFLNLNPGEEDSSSPSDGSVPFVVWVDPYDISPQQILILTDQSYNEPDQAGNSYDQLAVSVQPAVSGQSGIPDQTGCIKEQFRISEDLLGNVVRHQGILPGPSRPICQSAAPSGSGPQLRFKESIGK